MAPWAGLIMVFGLPWSNAFFAIGLAGMLVCLLAAPKRWLEVLQTVQRPVVYLSLLLLAVICLGFFYTQAPAELALHDLKKYQKLLMVPVFVALYPGATWSRRVVAAYAAGVMVLMLPTLMDGAAVAAGMPWLAEGWAPFRNESYNPESLVYWRNHIVHGFHVVILFVICVSTLLSRGAGQRLWAALVAVFVVLDVVFLIHGRAALLSLLLVCFIWALSYGSARLRTGMALVLVLLSWGVYQQSEKLQARVHSVFQEGAGYVENQDSQTSGGIRLHYWRMSLEMFRESPLLGTGPGSFRQRLEEPTNPLRDQTHRHAHNEYISLLSQHGMVGLFIFLALVWQIVRAARGHPDPRLSRILQMGLLIFLINAATDSSLHNQSEGWTFVLLAALSAAAVASPKRLPA